MSPSQKCNVSTGGRLSQWSTFFYHKSGTYEQHMIVSHYDIPRGGCVELERRPQHSVKQMSLSQRDVAGLVMKVLGMSTNDSSSP